MFALLLPDVRVESFQAFLDEFIKFIGEKTGVRLITDGAAAHRSARLKVSEELRIEHLPPYSPELNPVERVLKELRQELKNRVFESLQSVEEAVIEAIEPFMKDGSRVKKLTFYGWLQASANLNYFCITPLQIGQRILQEDPYGEDIYGSMMRAHAALENKVAVKDLFEILRRKKLGFEPSHTTQKLHRELIK